jgi:hypothetical protein
LLFGDLTEGSCNFLGGSEVDVRSMSYPKDLLILNFKKGKMGMCMLSVFILERSTFTYIRSNDGFYHILCIFAMGSMLKR